MSKADFDAFVKRQQAEEKENSGFDPEKQRLEWLNHLSSLYTQIESYLRTYVDNGTAKIGRRNIQLNEEFIGSYTAPELNLTIGRSSISFTPIGTMLIGTKGRVDVLGPLGTARLVLINKDVTHPRQLIQVSVTIDGHAPPALPTKQAAKQIEWTWKISTPPPKMEFLDLTQDTFFNMILALANG